MAREMLKLRKGDSAIMIKTDGSIELAGTDNKPLMDDKGMISPIILFAAAWAKKDQKVIAHLVDNFKNTVREGYFGADAQNDLKSMEVEAAKQKLQAASGAVTTEQPKIEPNISPEEHAKQKKEEEILEQIAAAGQDPQVLRQMEAMKAGAKKTETSDFVGHKQPDLKLEETFAYQDATPEEQQKMKMEESLKILNASDAKTPEEAKKVLADAAEKKEEPIVGNVTIEEGVPNENK